MIGQAIGTKYGPVGNTAHKGVTRLEAEYILVDAIGAEHRRLFRAIAAALDIYGEQSLPLVGRLVETCQGRQFFREQASHFDGGIFVAVQTDDGSTTRRARLFGKGRGGLGHGGPGRTADDSEDEDGQKSTPGKRDCVHDVSLEGVAPDQSYSRCAKCIHRQKRKPALADAGRASEERWPAFVTTSEN